MATIKTSKLSGAALDWAVLIAQFPIMREARPMAAIITGGNPSTNWTTGGPIIEREGIHIGRIHTLLHQRKEYGEFYWIANGRRGPTPLIAAMRCYVASKLGDTVDIPDELVS